MYENDWANIGSVTILQRHGWTMHFDSLSAAVSWLGRDLATTCLQDTAFSQNGFSRSWYELRDDLGLLIPRSMILAAVKSVSTYREYRRWRPRGHFKFRDGPVPHTRCWRSTCRWRSHQRHIGAKKAHEAYLLDETLQDLDWARKGRRKYVLVNPWDDRMRSDYGVRSWKSNRKTQWKERPQGRP